VASSDPRLTDARTPTAHAHVDADIPAGIARDSEVTAAVTAHEQAANPHTGYATDADLTAHAATPHGGGGGSPQFFVPLLTDVSGVLTNAPVGGVEPVSQMSRRQVDLRNTINFVLEANLSAALSVAGAVKLQYSINAGGAWTDMGGNVTGAINTLLVGTATAVPAAAKIASCWLRLLVVGDGVADPNIRWAGVMFQGA
jgi:hypothetical protein